MAIQTHSSADATALAAGSMTVDGGLRLVAGVLLAIVALVTAIILAGTNVDLAVTRWFAVPVWPHFPAAGNTLVAALRDRGMVAGIVCAACIALATFRFLPGNLPGIPVRAAAYLTTAYLLGPGLLVNGILKTYWGRPRPAQVIEFGGTLPFVNWWDPGGTCASNCSFISGEAAAAAWLFGAAMLAPPRWRPLTMSLAAAFFVMTCVLRVAAGGHFVTDVVIGGLSSVIVLLALRPLFYPKAMRTDALV
jgi:membrane-associated phospholipid phosphatase